MFNAYKEIQVELTQQQTQELQRLKAYFPYRIVFGVFHQDGSFEAYAKTTMHTANHLARNGASVFIFGNK